MKTQKPEELIKYRLALRSLGLKEHHQSASSLRDFIRKYQKPQTLTQVDAVKTERPGMKEIKENATPSSFEAIFYSPIEAKTKVTPVAQEGITFPPSAKYGSLFKYIDQEGDRAPSFPFSFLLSKFPKVHHFHKQPLICVTAGNLS